MAAEQIATFLKPIVTCSDVQPASGRMPGTGITAPFQVADARAKHNANGAATGNECQLDESGARGHPRNPQTL